MRLRIGLKRIARHEAVRPQRQMTLRDGTVGNISKDKKLQREIAVREGDAVSSWNKVTPEEEKPKRDQNYEGRIMKEEGAKARHRIMKGMKG